MIKCNEFKIKTCLYLGTLGCFQRNGKNLLVESIDAQQLSSNKANFNEGKVYLESYMAMVERDFLSSK